MKQFVIFLLFFPAFAIGQISDDKFPIEFSLKTLDGHEENLSHYRNKPVVLDFFATWCKPCIVKYNSMKHVYHEWQEKFGVQILLVSIDREEDFEKLNNLKDKYSWPFTILLDPNQELFNRLNGGNRSVPRSFFFSSDGTLHATSSGAKITIKGESDTNTLSKLYDSRSEMSDMEVDLSEYQDNIEKISVAD